MTKNEIYYDVKKIFKKDLLSEFISLFTFSINSFGHQFNDPTTCCGDRLIGDFELIYVIGGESFITIQDKEYYCSKGDMIFIPPFTKHKIQTSVSNPHNNYWLHFDVYPFYRQQDFISAMLSTQINHETHIGVDDSLLKLYLTFEQEAAHMEPGSMTILNTLLTQIITMMFRANKRFSVLEAVDKQDNTAELDIINKSILVIEKNLNKTIKIQDICNEIHVSESCLYKTFSKVIKIPPNNFIQLYKIKKAEQLIKSTNLSFKEISERVGFSSPYYFSDVFKRFYKMSPKEYASRLKY
jgi:AraC-like DNA-binding protein